MAAAGDIFSDWLNDKLQKLNTDETVFGTYITGILEGEESNEEKVEALEGILSEIIINDISIVVKEILDKWISSRPIQIQAQAAETEDVDTRLARLLESQTLATTVQRQYTAEELRVREAVLAQYSQLSDEDEDEVVPSLTEGEADLVKNTNAADVIQANKERREQARMDSQKKKDKDKEDREKQKQQREEKKEKRKTQKGERRR